MYVLFITATKKPKPEEPFTGNVIVFTTTSTTSNYDESSSMDVTEKESEQPELFECAQCSTKCFTRKGLALHVSAKHTKKPERLNELATGVQSSSCQESNKLTYIAITEQTNL